MHISDRDWRWSLEKYICLRTANDLWAAFHSSISQVEKFLPLLCSYNLYFVRGYLWEVMQPWAVLCETWCMSCVHECKYRNKINKYGNFITGRLRLAKFEAPLKRLWRGRKTEEPGLLPFNFFFFSPTLVPVVIWFHIIRTFQGTCQCAFLFCYLSCFVSVLNRCMPMPQSWVLLSVTGFAWRQIVSWSAVSPIWFNF